MKIYSKQSIYFLSVLLFTLGCSKNGDNQATPSPTIPVSNITFSNSPFDLQDINAKFAKDTPYDNKARTQSFMLTRVTKVGRNSVEGK